MNHLQTLRIGYRLPYEEPPWMYQCFKGAEYFSPTKTCHYPGIDVEIMSVYGRFLNNTLLPVLVSNTTEALTADQFGGRFDVLSFMFGMSESLVSLAWSDFLRGRFLGVCVFPASFRSLEG